MLLKKVLKTLRVQQWSKNLLVFLPLILSHQFKNHNALFATIVSFIVFCFMASSVYILNDIIDVESDRAHPTKRNRPIASGEISLFFAISLGGILFSASLLIALAFGGIEGALFPLFYIVLNIAYSFYLKRTLILDVFFLTGFYLIRIFYGGAVTEIIVSYWMLSFSFFIFLSLAVMKRYSEILLLYNLQGGTASSGRVYTFDDLPALLAIGIGTGIGSVIVLSMYFQFGVNPELYSSPKFLWAIQVILLAWICNIWIRARKGKVDDDPIKFAVFDIYSIVTFILIIMFWLLAI